MRVDLRRFLFAAGVLWILTLLILFSVYGAIQFWDRHASKWSYGGTGADAVAIGAIALSVFWVFFILKTLKDELKDQTTQAPGGIDTCKGLYIDHMRNN